MNPVPSARLGISDPSSMVWARREPADSARRRNDRKLARLCISPPARVTRSERRRKYGRPRSSAMLAWMSYFPFAPTGEARLDAGRECPTGHVGLAHSQVAFAGAVAWLGNHQPHSAAVAGHVPDRAGVAVSRPASIREARLGDVLLADHPEQPNREVLRSHGGGKAGTRGGDRALALLHGRRGPRHRRAVGEASYFARILL